MTGLKIVSQPMNAITGLIKISGTVDANNFEQLEDELNRLVESGIKGAAVDFSDLEGISSAGLGAFVNLAVLLRDRGGKVMIAGLRQDLGDLVDMLGVREVLGVVEKMDAAKRELSSIR